MQLLVRVLQAASNTREAGMKNFGIHGCWLTAAFVGVMAIGCDAPPATAPAEPAAEVQMGEPAGPDTTPAPPGQTEEAIPEPVAAPPAEETSTQLEPTLPEPLSAPPSELALEPVPVTPAVGAAPVSDAPVGLRIMDWDQTQALVKQHAGKVVVVDIWSTYCPPCRAEFPGLVKMHNELGEKVSCISVSFDYEGFDDMPVESYREKVLAFLTKNNSTLTNVLCSTAPEEVFLKKIDHASLPVVYVFDKAGNVAGQFPDPKDPAEFTYAEHVRPLVEKLIAAP